MFYNQIQIGDNLMKSYNWYTDYEEFILVDEIQASVLNPTSFQKEFKLFFT